MIKKTVNIKNEDFLIVLAKTALILNSQPDTLTLVLAELMRLQKDGRILFEYNGLNECHKRLNVNYQTFRTSLRRLEERDLIKREGHAIYLHPMLSGQFDSWEMRKI